MLMGKTNWMIFVRLGLFVLDRLVMKDSYFAFAFDLDFELEFAFEVVFVLVLVAVLDFELVLASAMLK